MRILLIGEYSRLHNSLKEGLLELGHEVVLASSGDGFKDFPSDYNYNAKWCNFYLLNSIRQIIYRITKFDCAILETGIRFYFLLAKFKNFDVVQLINERPIKTLSWLELYCLKKLKKQNQKLFVLSCGIDYGNVKFYNQNKSLKSIYQPLFKNPNLEKHYIYCFNYLKNSHQKITTFINEYCDGIIATDFDYVPPLIQNKNYVGLIPYPVNTSMYCFEELNIQDEIIIFLGINRWNYHQKGIVYFEKALESIAKKYGHRISIISTENMPYPKYIETRKTAHILLDQVFANDQGYNALEAMAKGKVVFTGAEADFLKHYSLLEDEVVINALPDSEYIAKKLSFLIDNPTKIKEIGRNASAFVANYHDYKKISFQYLNVWSNKSV